MNTLQAHAREILEAFTAKGIRATTDPRNLAIPGAFLAPNEIKATNLDPAGLTITWDVYLVALITVSMFTTWGSCSIR